MQFVMTSEFYMCPLIMLPLTVSVVDGASCIRCACAQGLMARPHVCCSTTSIGQT